MDISKQVCTLEQAKRLNELGVVQGKSIFYYDCGGGTCRLCFADKNEGDGYYEALSCYSAFTGAELGVMLPNKHGHCETRSYYDDHIGGWFSDYRVIKTDGPHIDWSLAAETEGDTEAEARAALVIHLIENKIITTEEINQRLLDNRLISSL